MKSMTGYAYKETQTKDVFACCEVKSVNSRFLDLQITAPAFLAALEKDFRKIISKSITRGKVDVNIRLCDTNLNYKIKPNLALAKEYMRAFCQVAASLDKDSSLVPLSLILEKQDVIEMQCNYDTDKYKSILQPLLEATLKDFVLDTQREGNNLANDIMQKINTLKECTDFFEQWQPQMQEAFKTQLQTKLKDLLDTQIQEQRLMQEVACLLTRYTINEEVIRLKSHIASLVQEIKQNPAPGKKIDFLCQEINREINTIGSKSQFAQVSQKVITAKDALENIKEQARNIV